MTIDKISVIGTGTMGSGIVQALAQAGRKVTMKSRSEASNTKAMGRITKSLGKLVEKGKMEQAAMDATLANITVTTDYKDIADSDLIIEAAVEEMDLQDAGRHVQARDHHRHQHFLAVHHRHSRRYLQALPRDRHALLQSRHSDEAR